jgi:hypothetical protein
MEQPQKKLEVGDARQDRPHPKKKDLPQLGKAVALSHKYTALVTSFDNIKNNSSLSLPLTLSLSPPLYSNTFPSHNQ